MKKIIFFATFVFISVACFSQDIISLKRGARVEAIITEITPTLVRYKLFSAPDGRVYFVYKEDVSGIMYHDGRVETFDQPSEQKTETESSPVENQNKEQQQEQNQNQNQEQEQKQEPVLIQNQNQIQYPSQIQSQNMNQYDQKSNYSIEDQEDPTMRSNYVAPVHKSYLQVHAGLAFPLSNFADGDNPQVDNPVGGNKGFAGMGFNAGFKYYGYMAENLLLVLGIEAYYNGVKSDAKNNWTDDPNAHVTFPKFFNFPLTAGLNYAFPFQDNFKFYVEAALGGNLSMMTKISSSGGKYDGSQTFTPAFGFAYGLEAGFFLFDKLSIGLRYNSLGSYQYKYKDSFGNDLNPEKKFLNALPITNVSVCLGIWFSTKTTRK